MYSSRMEEPARWFSRLKVNGYNEFRIVGSNWLSVVGPSFLSGCWLKTGENSDSG